MERSRWDLGSYLRTKGIETKWSYYPLHLQDQYAELARGDLGACESAWNRLLYLPADAGLSADQVAAVGGAVRAFFQEA